MEEVIKLIIGIIVLIMGYFIGEILARYTKEELNPGRRYIKMVVMIGLIGGVIGLIIKNDFVLFGFFFMAIVASRSLVIKKKSNGN